MRTLSQTHNVEIQLAAPLRARRHFDRPDGDDLRALINSLESLFGFGNRFDWRDPEFLRVRGRGVPSGTGRNAGKPGDLMVKLEVIVPTALTDEQRAAVESLAAVSDEAPRVAVEG